MFHQILVDKRDQRWQRVLWRNDSSDPVLDYNLTTVTNVTSCAPYLALRVILQLAQNERQDSSLGAKFTENNFYVDDIFAGADLINADEMVKNQLIDILKRGGFPLSKWAPNEPSLCSDERSTDKLFNESQGVSSLGVL